MQTDLCAGLAAADALPMEAPIPIDFRTVASKDNVPAHEALFRTLVEHGADAVFLIDLDTEECIYVSRPCVRCWGASRHS